MNKHALFDSIATSRAWCHFEDSYYHRHVGEYLRFLIPENASVLEIGCAGGERLAALKPRRGVGIDFSPKTIEAARRNFPHLDFFAQDIDDLECSETFDYVVVNNVIGYADDLQKAFRRIKKICRPQTKVILIYHSHLWRPFLRVAGWLGARRKWPQQHWLARKDIENLLYLEDFVVVRRDQRFLVPFYIPFVAWLFNKYLVHIPGLMDMALDHILIIKPEGPRRIQEDVSVSVVVPCRNEKGNIEEIITRTPMMGKRTEIIFVEGHSRDGTLEECQRLKEVHADKDIKVLAQKGEGKGDAVREGFAAASGDVLMILDADLTVPPEDLEGFYNALVSGKGEFINGSRLVYQMEKEAMRFLNMMANKFFSVMLTYLLGQYLKDTLCGTKVLWREDYLKIEEGRRYFGDFDPFGDFDLLFGAAKLNLKIAEIPVHYKSRVYGTTQIRRFEHGWLLLKMTIFAMRKIKFV